jgi:phage shock protein A
MNLIRRLYELTLQSTSAAIDRADRPEDRIRLMLHNIEENAPAIREAAARPLAQYHAAEDKVDRLTQEVAELEVKTRSAAGKNQEAARVLASQLLDRKAALQRAQEARDTCRTQADQAREQFEEWQRRTNTMKDEAFAALDESQRTGAEQQFNTVMAQFDTSDTASKFSQAKAEIDSRANQARAVRELSEDPGARAVREMERNERDSKIDDLLKSMSSQQPNATA